MKKNVPEIRIIEQPKAKLLIYVFIALVIGLVQVLEDFADDDIGVRSIIKEFAILFSILLFLFPILGWTFRKCWKQWRRIEILAQWKYSIFLLLLVCELVFPLILLFLVYPTFLVESKQDVWVVWVSSLIFVSIVMTIEVFWEILKNSQRLELTNERLLRHQEMAKYQALMNQLNPHFLFNSLNVLSYLVYKDQSAAEKFIEELSKIYRYILQLNETYLVPLKQEVDFINSYMYLQKIRHRNNLTYEYNIDANAYQKYIPPLTLEVLMENAIKHNIIDSNKPLHIVLSSKNNQLVIKNNIQLRNENEVQSNNIGLKNLKEKFQILGNEIPKYSVENDTFIVKVPLLDSEV